MKIRLKNFWNTKDSENYLAENQPFFVKQIFWQMRFSVLVIILRLILPPFILFHPLLIFILVSLLDCVDFVLLRGAGLEMKDYQRIDKSLDLYFQFFMMLFGLSTGYFVIFLALYLYRLLGIFFYFKRLNRHWLVASPNLVEVLFLSFVLSNAFALNFASVLAVLFVLKMIQEYYLILSERSGLTVFELETKGKSLKIVCRAAANLRIWSR